MAKNVIRFFIGTAKVFVLLVAVLVLLFCVLTLLFPNKYEKEKQNTIIVAQKYLIEYYEQEMVFENATRSKEESWSIAFSKKDNPDFIFTVQVSKNKKTKEFRVWRDDYIKTLIEYELGEKYKPIVEQMWGDHVHVIITYQTYAKDITYLNEYSTLDDIHSDDLNEKYRISIHIPYYFEDAEKDLEAEKIYNFIKVLQKDEYIPNDIAVYRKCTRNDASSDMNKEECCNIYHIYYIESIEQVYEYIDEKWFKKSK
jgi:hypothetical protein